MHFVRVLAIASWFLARMAASLLSLLSLLADSASGLIAAAGGPPLEQTVTFTLWGQVLIVIAVGLCYFHRKRLWELLSKCRPCRKWSADGTPNLPSVETPPSGMRGRW